MRRTLDTASIEIVGEEASPFLRYRPFLHSYHLARGRGLSDAGFVDLV